MVRLYRYPVVVAVFGHSRGQWLVVDHPLVVGRDGAGWKAYSTAASDAPPVEVRAYTEWLKRHGLWDLMFERRRDVLAALDTALTIDPPI